MKDRITRFFGEYMHFSLGKTQRVDHVEKPDSEPQELPLFPAQISITSLYMFDIILGRYHEDDSLRSTVLKKIVQAELVHERRTGREDATLNLNVNEMDFFNRVFSSKSDRYGFYIDELNRGFEKGGGPRRPAYQQRITQRGRGLKIRA